MNRPHAPCMFCGETVGRAATDTIDFWGVLLWVCCPCAEADRAEWAAIEEMIRADERGAK